MTAVALTTWTLNDAAVDAMAAALNGSTEAEGDDTPSSSGPAQRPPETREEMYALAALEREVGNVAATAEGGRNEALNRAAHSLGTLIGTGVLDAAVVRTSLLDAAMSAGLPASEARRTIHSGISAGVRKPRALSTILNGGASVGTSGAPVAANALPMIQIIMDGDPVPANSGWLIKNLLPRSGVALLAGVSGAAKTFLAIDAAVSGAIGADFFGRAVKQKFATLFVCGEGLGTMADRVEAARRGRVAHELSRRCNADGELPMFDPARLPIGWLSASNLSSPPMMHALTATIIAHGEAVLASHGVPLRLIVIDTLAACLGFRDENDAAETTAALQALDALSHATGALVLATAHHGKGDGAGVRGSSALTASADVILTTHVDKDTLGTVTCRSLGITKTRYGETGWATEFRLVPEVLREDEDGDPVTSCYVEPTGLNMVCVPRARRLSPAAKAYRDALAAVIGDHGLPIRPFGSDGPQVVAADRERVRDEFYRRWPADGATEVLRQSARRQRFSKGEKAAIESNVVGSREVTGRHMVWLLTE